MASVSLETAAAWVNEKLDAYENEEDENKLILRAVMSDIINYLSANGYAYSQTVSPLMCGVDETNRYGDMLDPQRVHNLIFGIFKSGFSLDETASALAREVHVVNDRDGLRANEDLGRISQGMLPSLDGSVLKIFTLSCSHTTSGLGCFAQGVRCNLGKLDMLCHDGRLSLAKLRELQPAYAEAVDKGLTYKIIRSQLFELCPRLASCAQEAYNMSHMTSQAESCFQVVRKVHAEAQKYQNANRVVPWDAIASRVAATRPQHAAHVNGYCAFVHKHVDADGKLLRSIGDYLKGVPDKASVKGSLYQALAEQPCIGASEYIEAAVCTMYNPGKAAFVKNGMSTVLASPDIGAISKRLWTLVQQVATILRDTKAMLKTLGLKPEDAVQLGGDFGRELVMHVHSKSKEFKSLSEVVWWMQKEVRKKVGAEKAAKFVIPKCWGVHPEKSQPRSSAANPSTVELFTSSMQTRDESGSIDMIQELHRLGFVVGTAVTSKEKPGIEFTILKFTKSSVSLASSSNGTTPPVTIGHAAFISDFSLAKTKASLALDIIPNASDAKAWLEALMDARAKLVLEAAWNAEREKYNVNEFLSVFAEGRKVVAKANIRARLLKLVPLSLMGKPVEADATTEESLTIKSLKFDFGGKTMVYSILPKQITNDADPFVVPFFFVRANADLARTNMEMATLDVRLQDSELHKVPVMTNKVPIAAGSELKIYKLGKGMALRQVRGHLQVEEPLQKKRRAV